MTTFLLMLLIGGLPAIMVSFLATYKKFSYTGSFLVTIAVYIAIFFLLDIINPNIETTIDYMWLVFAILIIPFSIIHIVARILFEKTIHHKN